MWIFLEFIGFYVEVGYRFLFFFIGVKWFVFYDDIVVEFFFIFN